MNNYTCDTYLGKGSFGAVRLAVHKQSGSKRAIKFIENTDKATCEQEVTVLKLVEHKFIIKYYESFFSSSLLFCIVLEYADAGTLTKVVAERNTSLDEHQIWRITSHIASALNYIHSLKPNHVLHRDLKPDNVLGVYTWNTKANAKRINWKLADFGIAKLLTIKAQEQYYTSTIAGTPIYMAPEVMDEFQKYSFPADIWSFGCLLSFYVNARHLFTSLTAIHNWTARSPLKGYSQNLDRLLSQMLHTSTKNRPKAANILAATHEENRQRHDIP